MSLWLQLLARLGITVTTTITAEQLTVVVFDRENKFIAINRRYKTTRISWKKHNGTPDETDRHIERKQS